MYSGWKRINFCLDFNIFNLGAEKGLKDGFFVIIRLRLLGREQAMKLLYTGISNDLTAILFEEARQFAAAGKRVFYIAPNSLSFEKEQKVLSLIPERASFAITITRFAQLARYFSFRQAVSKENIDDTGLTMLLYRLLSQFSERDLKAFGRLKQDPNFVKQLLDLYKELKTANMTAADLKDLESPEKAEDLQKIFASLEDNLQAGNYDNQSKLSFLADKLQSGQLDQVLQDTVFIIDGFTRFSVEEEHLVTLLNNRCADLVIGTYVSQKAYQSNFSAGNVYQAGLDFIRHLAAKFHVKPELRESVQKSLPAFDKLSRIFEGNHDFRPSDLVLTEADKQHLTIWEVINQKEEVEQVAKAIRQKLYEGHRYKDILVLLGDVDSYRLQIGKIFDKYEIPYDIARAESMSAHPLVHFMESLRRIKRYNFRPDDVMNLFKSGLYGQISQDQLDKFEQYVIYADIKGQAKFARNFTLTKQGKFDLAVLNQWREALVTPLQELTAVRKQLGKNLLQKLLQFFEKVSLTENFTVLAKSGSENQLERHEEVWKTFSHILEQFHQIFGDHKMTLDELLSLLGSGMMAAQYRTVPAAVDVVAVKSYDLVEPHSKPFVFALGMIQSHFPKIAQNKTLISDQERLKINEAKEKTETHRRFDVISKENLKKNHFAALSLFNAASQELVLSLPQILNESEDSMSSYLKELVQMGVPLVEKGRHQEAAAPEDIGNYKALLSRLVTLNRSDITQELSEKEETFWTAAVRYLRRKLDKEGIAIPTINAGLVSKKVSQEVMDSRFPSTEPLRLSASALETFYNNQYLYFLRYVLGLQEVETVRPDARNYGTYLHRVFELYVGDKSSDSFDQKLDRAIAKTKSEEAFRLLYADNQDSRYALEVLDDIARSTGSLLAELKQDQVKSQEAPFDFLLDQGVKVTGFIDRIDYLPEAGFGVVDYKSGKHTFDIRKFYNGLNSQLPTYLEALHHLKDMSAAPFFGAMYLHMQEPKLKLSEVNDLAQLVEKAHKELSYKGLFRQDSKAVLTGGNYQLTNSLYSEDELAVLLAHNKGLYRQAAQQIRQGTFLINPYSQDGRSVQGEQLKAITGFEADRHMSYARQLIDIPTKKKREAFLELMQGKETDNA